MPYKLCYDVNGATEKVRFAGREFDANVEEGKSWKGPWINKMDDVIYLSFLPKDGGTIKFQFDPDRWISGNCKEPFSTRNQLKGRYVEFFNGEDSIL